MLSCHSTVQFSHGIADSTYEISQLLFKSLGNLEHFRKIKLNIMLGENINRRLWNNLSSHNNLGAYGNTF